MQATNVRDLKKMEAVTSTTTLVPVQKKVLDFQEFQIFCSVKLHRILHPTQTRWLSVHSVLNRILEQYEPLRLYFTDAGSQQDVLATENILFRLNDPTRRLLFLVFLSYVHFSTI